MKKYLLYVRKYNIIAHDYLFYVYDCVTNDIFHTLGEVIFRTEEHIQRIDFVEDTPSRREYWANEGVTIYPWIDKYPYFS